MGLLTPFPRKAFFNPSAHRAGERLPRKKCFRRRGQWRANPTGQGTGCPLPQGRGRLPVHDIPQGRGGLPAHEIPQGRGWLPARDPTGQGMAAQIPPGRGQAAFTTFPPRSCGAPGRCRVDEDPLAFLMWLLRAGRAAASVKGKPGPSGAWRIPAGGRASTQGGISGTAVPQGRGWLPAHEIPPGRGYLPKSRRTGEALLRSHRARGRLPAPCCRQEATVSLVDAESMRTR